MHVTLRRLHVSAKHSFTLPFSCKVRTSKEILNGFFFLTISLPIFLHVTFQVRTSLKQWNY